MVANHWSDDGMVMIHCSGLLPMSQRPGKANRPKNSLRDSALLTCPIGRLVTAGQQLFYFGALANEVVFDKSLSRVIVHFDAVLGQP